MLKNGSQKALMLSNINNQTIFTPNAQQIEKSFIINYIQLLNMVWHPKGN